MQKKLVILFLIISTLGCASSEKGEVSFGQIPRPVGSYSSVLDQWTRTQRAYSGVYETFRVTSTLVSKDVAEHQVFIESEQFHKTTDQHQAALQKQLYDMQTEATFFVTLYTEKDDNNNLDKSDSVWNVYLMLNDQRFKPQSIKRVFEKKSLLETKYPYIDVWSRNYIFRFPISTTEVQAGNTELFVTGPLGTAKLKYSTK